uniref:Ribosomal RNA-processing protein 8 n=1 Tax=Ciona savignyi TaxID=51511 RepID=H2Z072_CIOSA
MFDCVDWDESGENGSELTEALFGDVKKQTVPSNVSSGNVNAHDMSRKQWRLKQRNKRKCVNKYRSKEESDLKSSEKSDQPTENAKSPKDIKNVPKVIDKVSKQKKNTSTENAKTRKDIENAPEMIDKVSKQSKPKNFHVTKASSDNMNESCSPPKKRKVKIKEQVNEVPTNKENESSKSLKDRLVEKLESSRFRFINEQIYSQSSGDTHELFNSDPTAFQVYHRGFGAQVATWPVNPLDGVIRWVKERSPKLIIADFGCGEAMLASSVKNKVHSFDLVAVNDRVTVADIAKVPLADSSVDIVVFCLSLMGTNLVEFLVEANRVLKLRGVLKIAEVASRFSGLKQFYRDLKKIGFDLHKKDTTNSHFFMFDFFKTKNSPPSCLSNDYSGLKLKACAYKKR